MLQHLPLISVFRLKKFNEYIFYGLQIKYSMRKCLTVQIYLKFSIVLQKLSQIMLPRMQHNNNNNNNNNCTNNSSSSHIDRNDALKIFNHESMDKLQLTGRALGRVFNFRSGCMHTMHLLPRVAVQPNLELRSRPKQLLGSLLLVIALPASSKTQLNYDCKKVCKTGSSRRKERPAVKGIATKRVFQSNFVVKTREK